MDTEDGQTLAHEGFEQDAARAASGLRLLTPDTFKKNIGKARHPSRRAGWLDMGHSDLPDLDRPGWGIAVAYAHERTGEWHVLVRCAARQAVADVWVEPEPFGAPASRQAVAAACRAVIDAVAR